MSKIKRKVEMRLPELIEWAWANEVRNKAFYSKYTGGSAFFDEEQILYLEHETRKDETFTVEVEEEIDENTVLNEVLEIYGAPYKDTIFHKNKSINEIVNKDECESIATNALHLINSDGTMTLLWKDGEMIK